MQREMAQELRGHARTLQEKLRRLDRRTVKCRGCNRSMNQNHDEAQAADAIEAAVTRLQRAAGLLEASAKKRA